MKLFSTLLVPAMIASGVLSAALQPATDLAERALHKRQGSCGVVGTCTLILKTYRISQPVLPEIRDASIVDHTCRQLGRRQIQGSTSISSELPYPVSIRLQNENDRLPRLEGTLLYDRRRTDLGTGRCRSANGDTECRVTFDCT